MFKYRIANKSNTFFSSFFTIVHIIIENILKS